LLDIDVAMQIDLPAEFSTYRKAGSVGYTVPTCVYCPGAEYTREALRRHLQGLVELDVVVREDGRVKDISVVKGLPGGLTQKAIDTVKTWKLKPALGPNEKPAVVQQIIKVDFRLI
jgi:TonB family protein